MTWKNTPKTFVIPSKNGYYCEGAISDSPGLFIAIVDAARPATLLANGFQREHELLKPALSRDRTLLVAIARTTNKGRNRITHIALVAFNALGREVFRRGLTKKGSEVADAVSYTLEPMVKRVTIVPF